MVVKKIKKVINEVAFPAPQEPIEFYQETLLNRNDLIWLDVGKNQRVPAIYIKGGRSLKSKFTVLYSHGNGEDLGVDSRFLDEMQKRIGADLFAYDYVGYSLNRFEPGDKNVPSVSGCKKSIMAAWKYLTTTANVPPKDIIIYGRSIGSGPSVYLAGKVGTKKKSGGGCAGVILQAPLESAFRAVLGPKTATCCVCFDFFRNHSIVHKLRCKVGIMHGTEDEVVPISNGEALHKKLKHPHEPHWVEGHGHNDIPAEYIFEYAKNFVNMLREERRGPDTNLSKEEMRKKRLAAMQNYKQQQSEENVIVDIE
eukprot:CAMPEP_0204823238 /NCGR_PEP_ID=MMETSP1346-20131115/1315_1 /ASSEMBLY_ACC=CAM_ASM_000771 /TAXON_ID=215587 /ORGANISM="Aplanochytrium stocchinoi, Strain GSBS06" /LENGTH=309 /DNA_ID=CAMNT_0051949795 /DNA_START=243 /DNA_END=1173 /DNA_ORIENTATION=-